MLKSFVLAAALLPAWIHAEAPQPAEAPPAEATPTQPAPPENAPAAAAKAGGNSEQQHFDRFRRDLVNLLALRAEPDLLVAAAELAYPDGADKNRPSALKSPALLKRAQKYGPDSALVWWVTTFIGCAPEATGCPAEAATRLQQLAPDNAAAWLPSLHAAKDAGQARALLASMAQAQRFDDYWSPGVLAVFRALQTLPVPPEVLSHGLNTTAARINLATSVGGGFLPNYARLGDLCAPGQNADDALTADCLAIARLLESGGTFRSQAIGFGIEDRLLPAGTARDVLRSRQRASAWQKQQFLDVSGRFPREEALAQTYTELLRKHDNELATVTALLRDQHVATDPPAGWQPPATDAFAPQTDPLAPPVH